jgi:hypothetical protein
VRNAHRSPVLCGVWLCGFVHRRRLNVRRLKTNKEEEEVGGRSPTLG